MVGTDLSSCWLREANGRCSGPHWNRFLPSSWWQLKKAQLSLRTYVFLQQTDIIWSQIKVEDCSARKVMYCCVRGCGRVRMRVSVRVLARVRMRVRVCLRVVRWCVCVCPGSARPIYLQPNRLYHVWIAQKVTMYSIVPGRLNADLHHRNYMRILASTIAQGLILFALCPLNLTIMTLLKSFFMSDDFRGWPTWTVRRNLLQIFQGWSPLATVPSQKSLRNATF